MRFGAAIPERNCADMSGASPVLPLALVLPRTVEDVSKILELCNAHRRPVVPQGGMTGLVTGAHPKADEIAISLERMTGVEEIKFKKGGTSSPNFEFVKWAPRPECLKEAEAPEAPEAAEEEIDEF